MGQGKRRIQGGRILMAIGSDNNAGGWMAFFPDFVAVLLCRGLRCLSESGDHLRVDHRCDRVAWCDVGDMGVQICERARREEHGGQRPVAQVVRMERYRFRHYLAWMARLAPHMVVFLRGKLQPLSESCCFHRLSTGRWWDIRSHMGHGRQKDEVVVPRQNDS